MSTGRTLVIVSTDSSDTERLGEQVGSALRGGEVIELISDLGGGKTTFVRGLARGMGSTAQVASPTFTINRKYIAKDLTLEHFDFYRLDDPGLAKHELAESISPQSVVVVEWPIAVKGVLPAESLKIEIKTKGENTRELFVSVPSLLGYVLSNVDSDN